MNNTYIRLIILDVDGTMTDGGVYYDANGNETKKFNTRDAAGIFAAQGAGIDVMVLTGRSSAAVEKRMTELKVRYLFQGVKDKLTFIQEFAARNRLTAAQIGYVGDDLNDYNAMRLMGFKACPADACAEIKAIADYVSVKNGGDGVIRDVMEYLLRKNGQWLQTVAKVYSLTGI